MSSSPKSTLAVLGRSARPANCACFPLGAERSERAGLPLLEPGYLEGKFRGGAGVWVQEMPEMQGLHVSAGKHVPEVWWLCCLPPEKADHISKVVEVETMEVRTERNWWNRKEQRFERAGISANEQAVLDETIRDKNVKLFREAIEDARKIAPKGTNTAVFASIARALFEKRAPNAQTIYDQYLDNKITALGSYSVGSEGELEEAA